MKYLNVVLAILLLGMLSCSDESLVGVRSEEEALETGTFDAAKTETAGVEDAMTLFMGMFTYAAKPEFGFVPCLDPEGNPAPGAAFPVKANVEGRAFYLDETTGYFTTNQCHVQTDGNLTSAGDWRFIGNKEGHSVLGTWTATILPDGSLNGKTVITGGIGMFGGATGWMRFAGRIDLAAGRGEFHGKGLISSPKAVVTMGFVQETQFTSTTGSVACVDRGGIPRGGSGTRRFEGTGLGTYLGAFSFVAITERCILDGEVYTHYGTWSYTNAQGDVLRGTYAAVIGVGDPWPNETIITGGEGRFEGATGWEDNLVYGDHHVGEGVIFMPR